MDDSRIEPVSRDSESHVLTWRVFNDYNAATSGVRIPLDYRTAE